MIAAITVLIRLMLKLLAEMIRHGLQYTDSEPDGSGREAHQTSPRCITTSHGKWTVIELRLVRYLVTTLPRPGRTLC